MSLRRASKQNVNAAFSLTNPGVGGLTAPVISSVLYTDNTYTSLDDTAISLAGGYVRIIGSGFGNPFSLYLNGIQVTSGNTTYVSSTEVRALLPASSLGTYALMLFNGNNSGAVLPNSVFYSPFPTYGVPVAVAIVNNVAFSQQLGASGDAPLVYSIISGTLPTGVTLNSSGVLSGTTTGYLSNQTFNFTIQVNDGQLQTITQAISLTVQVGDPQWNYTTLLLNGDTSATATTFINDSSLNNNQLTIAGDVKPTLFNPYTDGYYSYFGEGSTSDYLQFPARTGGWLTSGNNFTVEAWIYMTKYPQAHPSYAATIAATAGNSNGWEFTVNGGTGSSAVSISFAMKGVATATYTATLLTNTWYHVAGVKNSSVLTCYVNGVAGATTATLTTWTDNTTMWVGADTAPSYPLYFYGYISNFRLVNGSAVYTTNFTPPTVPLISITNTLALACQSNRYIDNGPNNFTITPSGTGNKVSSSTPFTQPTSVLVNTGNSVYFNGTTDNLTVATNAAFQFGTGDFTIETWIWPNDLSANNTNNFINIGTYLTGILMRTNSSGGIQLYFVGTSKIPVQAGLTAKAWNHVALVRIGTTCTLYIGGTSNYSFTDSTSLSPATATVTIGMAAHNSSEFFNGYISNMRIVKGVGVYTGAFTVPSGPLASTQGSGTNISAITGTSTSLLTLQGTQVTDASTNAFSITTGGTPKVVNNSYPFTQTTATVSNLNTLGSAYFDGTGDYLESPAAGLSAPNWAFDADFTIEFWFYSTSTSVQTMLSTWVFGSDAASNFICSLNYSTGYPRFTYSANSGVNVANVDSSVQYTVNQWQHYAVTRNGTSLKMWLNGINVATTTISGTFGTTTNPLRIGAGHNTGQVPQAFFVGYIEDIRIIKGTALYTSAFTPPTAPPTAVTNTRLLTLQYSGGANNNGMIDNSSFNNTIARFGNATQGTYSPYSQNGWSTYYNGTTDYHVLATNAAFAIGTADFTVETWAYPTSAAQVWGTIFAGVNYGTASDWGLYAGDGTTSLYPMFFFTSGSSPGSGSSATQGSFSITSNVKLALNSWSHVAVSRVSGTARMFINGTQVGVSVNASTWSLANTLQKAIAGGYNGNGSTLFPGYISNLRVVSGTGLYSANFTTPTSPLTPVTGTILLTNQSNRTIDNSANIFALATGGTPSVQAFSPFNGTSITPTTYSTKFDNTTGAYFTFSGKSSLALGTGDFTIESWVYRTQVVAQSDGWYTGTRSPTSSGGLGIKVQNNGVVAWNTSASFGSGTTAIPLYTWAHIAVTRQSGTLKWYVNGVLDYTTTLADNFSNPTAAIGITDDPYYSSLIISNFRLVTGAVVYTANFTPPTTPLTAITNTALLTCQSAVLKDNSATPATVTQFGTAQRQVTFNPFGQTTTTGVQYSPAVNGGSMYFDGTGDYLSIPPSSLFTFSGDFTIDAWVYPTVINADNVIISRWTSSLSFIFKIVSSGRPYLAWYKGSSGTVTGTSTAVLINQWNHVAATRVGSTVRLFVNGVLDATTGTIAGAFDTSTTAITVGSLDTTPSQLWNGYLADVRVINGAALYTASFYPPIAPLSPTVTIGTAAYSSVLLLSSTSGGIIDQHSTNVLETVGNTQLASEDPYSGTYYSNYSTGASGAYISVPSAAWTTLAGTFTVEFWINWMSAPQAGSFMGVQANGGWAMYNDGTRITPNLYGSANIFSSTFLTASIVLGKWYHIAITRNSSNLMTMWVDGASVGSTTTATTYTQGAWAIFSPGNVNASQGYISNHRVTNTCVYTTTFAPSTTPLPAVTGTQLLTCQTNKFVDTSTNAATLTLASTVSVKSINPFQQNTGKSLYFGTKTDTYTMRSTPAIANLPGDFTIECWVNPTDTSLSTTWGILDARSAGASASAWLICLSSYSSGWLMNIYTGTSYSGTTRVQANQWTHCAWVRVGSTVTFYVNGVAGGTATVSGAITGGTTTVVLGSKDNGLTGYGTVGYIKDLRITQGVARYTTSFAPSTALLLTR